MPRALGVHDKGRGVGARIVVTDGLDELAVTRRARVRDDHAIRRRFRLAYTTQADVHSQILGCPSLE